MDEEFTCDQALEILRSMVRLDRQFDVDLVAKIDDLLRAQPDENATGELVHGLLNIQRLFFLHLAPRRAIPASLKAVRWAKALGDKPLLARSLQYRGTMAANIYDLSTAFEATLEALKIGYEIDDADRIGACYLNLGSVLQRTGRYQAEQACIEASIRWYERTAANSENLGHALNGLVDQQMRSGNWQAALKASRRARRILDAVVPSEERLAVHRADYACILMNEVTALVHLSEFKAALNVMTCLKSLAERYPSKRIDAYQQFAEAVYESFIGDSDDAVEALNQFRDLPEMRDETLRYLATIFERRGEPKRALDVTRELLEGLRTARREITATDLARLSICSPGDDDEVIRDLVSRAAGFERVVEKVGDKFKAKLAYLFELAVNAELREEGGEHVGEHIYRVGRLCAALAAEAGCGEEVCWLAEVAGRAHDVGKTSVPSLTILKTGPLNHEEAEFLRSHAEDGAALVAQLAESRLVQVVAAVRHHHERWDGTGYPTKLKGEDIPLLARIVAICDSFDAMTHSRVYRAPRTVAGGLSEVERSAGSQFDPRLAGMFVNLVRRLQRDYGELDDYLGEPGRRTRWAKSHSELMRLLEESHAI